VDEVVEERKIELDEEYVPSTLNPDREGRGGYSHI
jgi:hypothetical protein